MLYNMKTKRYVLRKIYDRVFSVFISKEILHAPSKYI